MSTAGRLSPVLLLVVICCVAAGSELHVAPAGNDAAVGSPSAPLRSIQRAAELAQPGDTVIVHSGVYRERIDPPRGGTSDARRITFQAARGEKVEIVGSERIRTWERVSPHVWKAAVPNSLFGRFNPFADVIRGDWFDPRGRVHHTGAVYLNGGWLVEATKLDEVLAAPSAVPAWLAAPHDGYLVNVAWLRPKGAATRIEAARMSSKSGTQNAPCSEGGECVGFIRHGDWLRYEAVDFSAGGGELELRAASASDGGVIEIRRDRPNGELLGSCTVPNTGGWQSWLSYRARLKRVRGPISLCLVFRAHQTGATPGLWFAQVGPDTTTIWAQFPGIDPNKASVEINVRQAVFYPSRPNRDYITVRGFIMRHAATPWAPPTAEQIGLIGTHWSKGWVIEDNVISHSTCSGISLGKHGDRYDNTSANSAEGYVETIRRGLAAGWAKGRIGGHLVRNNRISYCEQAGIVGSLGAAFSTVTGNTIHDVHMRRLFSGAEMAGIKFHGAIDTTIAGNHIYRTCLGLWLDWMAQGTRVSSNAFHHNGLDLFMEVDHGPYVVDNNLFLSPSSLLSVSRGGAYAHNLFAGGLNIVAYDGRQTPFHKAHSTEVAGFHDNPRGDDRYYNNVFVRAADLSQYDDAKLPVAMSGNVFVAGAKPSKHELQPLVLPDHDAALRVSGPDEGAQLSVLLNPAWTTARQRRIVTSELLGKAFVPGLPFDQRDGSSVRLGRDYHGAPRGDSGLMPGPFAKPPTGRVLLRAHSAAHAVSARP